MPLDNPLFAGSKRLKEAYENTGRKSVKMSPAEDADAICRIQKALLLIDGPQKVLEFFPAGATREPNGIFGKPLADAVTRFQKRVFPGQPARHDGRVGKDTLDQFQKLLRGNHEHPLMQVEDSPSKDLLIFITGVKDKDIPGGDKVSVFDAGDQAEEFSKIRRPGADSRFLGLRGSLKNNIGIEFAIDFIIRNYDPEYKLVLYGYSAGAKQLLDLCNRIDLRNETSKPFIRVNLLVTNDACFGDQTPTINRTVPGSVLKNANFFQSHPFSKPNVGGPNRAVPARADESMRCEVLNTDMTLRAGLEAAARTFELEKATPHGVMQGLAHSRAMEAIRKEMAI